MHKETALWQIEKLPKHFNLAHFNTEIIRLSGKSA